jgi:hypothetical protein
LRRAGIQLAVAQLGAVQKIDPGPFDSSIYLLVGAAYVALSVYLWRYARAIKHLGSELAQTHLEHALEHQRKFWRLAGVLATLVIGFTFFGMVSAVVVPMFAGR